MSDLISILEAARGLPPDDRLQLVQTLWDEIAEDELTDDEKREIDRRLAEIKAHPERAVSAEEALARLEAKVRQ